MSLQNEEDAQMKEKIDLLMDRLQDEDLGQRKFALGQIKQEIEGATASMTSVPKPLKFASSHYEKITAFYET